MRVQRIASHSASSTAGNPAMTEREIANPLDAICLSWSVSKFPGPPRTLGDSKKIRITTPIWPTTIAANTMKPQSAVPQNFQTRGAASVAVSGGGEISESGIAGMSELAESIERLSGQRALQQIARVILGEVDRSIHAGVRIGEPRARE